MRESEMGPQIQRPFFSPPPPLLLYFSRPCPGHALGRPPLGGGGGGGGGGEGIKIAKVPLGASQNGVWV